MRIQRKNLLETLGGLLEQSPVVVSFSEKEILLRGARNTREVFLKNFLPLLRTLLFQIANSKKIRNSAFVRVFPPKFFERSHRLVRVSGIELAGRQELAQLSVRRLF
jgi:hypothetical protein